jgi:hypothetical protein
MSKTMNTTIEVLKKHIAEYNLQVNDMHKFKLSERELKMFSAAMQEWASLRGTACPAPPSTEEQANLLKRCFPYIQGLQAENYTDRNAGVFLDEELQDLYNQIKILYNP